MHKRGSSTPQFGLLCFLLAPGACGGQSTENEKTNQDDPKSSETQAGTEPGNETDPGSDDGDGDGDGDPNECSKAVEHPEWIFCDDFESDNPLVGKGRYFEAAGSDIGYTHELGVGWLDSAAMQSQWTMGQVDAGSLKLGFGRNPNAYMNRGIRDSEDFRELWYRVMVKHEDGWNGDPAKLSRATVFSSSDDWSQAMIAHLWGDGSEHILLDPASCVQGSDVQCVGYNDFTKLSWLGNKAGPTAIFSTNSADHWYCVEAHVRLDDPGQSNGLHEFWIDGQLEAQRDDLAFVHNYSAYAINAVFLENYWNDGSPQEQKRWMDNFIVSTAPIGCP